jgi:hypothetical protein
MIRPWSGRNRATPRRRKGRCAHRLSGPTHATVPAGPGATLAVGLTGRELKEHCKLQHAYHDELDMFMYMIPASRVAKAKLSPAHLQQIFFFAKNLQQIINV